jgi:hypothetical protein
MLLAFLILTPNARSPVLDLFYWEIYLAGIMPSAEKALIDRHKYLMMRRLNMC